MKILIYFTGILFFFGCAPKKNTKDTFIETFVENTKVENSLSKNEKNIVNDFLDFELKKNKYKNYDNFKILLIKEGIGKISSLNIYRYCYEERNLQIRSATNKDWVIDSVEIKNIQDTVKNKNYLWKTSDITNFKVDTIGVMTINKSTKSYKDYDKYKNKLVIYLSVPLIIKTNNALISYKCSSVVLGYRTIDMFTALLKKSENEKWKIDSYYYDPNSSW